MDAWTTPSQPPGVKFENSPAESLLSIPGDMYPSLFATPSSGTTMNPMEIMTPPSFNGKELDTGTSDEISRAGTPTDGAATTSEKKQTKKRKSWGQVLPEPKTNLPPRKRAKTEDEKEQRRVERVLRNRRAAQSSRERKRLEVEALEKRNQELEAKLLAAEKTNMMLFEMFRKAQSGSGVTSIDSLRPNAIATFSHELFSSQDGHGFSLDQTKQSLMGDLFMSSTQSQKTVNPASLSPALTPVPDDEEEDDGEDDEEEELAPEAPKAAAEPASTTVTTSPDETRHPAEMLWQDLQCQSAEVPRSWMAAPRQSLNPALALFMQLSLLLTTASSIVSICQRPLTQIAFSMRAGFSLPPTPPILKTIIWLVTQPSSTSMNSSTTTRATASSPAASAPASQPQSSTSTTTLRLRSLRKILTCSPILARPLTDATMAALRLVVSKERRDVDQVGVWGVDSVVAADDGGVPAEEQVWLNGAELPSREVLLTLLWAIKVEERRMHTSNQLRRRSTTNRQPGKMTSRLLKKVTSIKKQRRPSAETSGLNMNHHR